MNEDMNFGDAIAALKRGKAVSRRGWNGKGLWLTLQVPDTHSKMTLPYIYLTYPSADQFLVGGRVPWHPSQTDVLAEDWLEVSP